MYCLLLFHCNNGYTSAPQCYIVRTLPVLLDVMPCILVNSNVSNDNNAFTFRVKALRSLKTSVNISQSTTRNVPEDMSIQGVKILSRFTEGTFHLRCLELTIINHLRQ
jgi:hypothetical protein